MEIVVEFAIDFGGEIDCVTYVTGESAHFLHSRLLTAHTISPDLQPVLFLSRHEVHAQNFQ
jgi:hypothetical protein